MADASLAASDNTPQAIREARWRICFDGFMAEPFFKPRASAMPAASRQDRELFSAPPLPPPVGARQAKGRVSALRTFHAPNSSARELTWRAQAGPETRLPVPGTPLGCDACPCRRR